jgi:hypothetical protein
MTGGVPSHNGAGDTRLNRVVNGVPTCSWADWPRTSTW